MNTQLPQISQQFLQDYKRTFTPTHIPLGIALKAFNHIHPNMQKMIPDYPTWQKMLTAVKIYPFLPNTVETALTTYRWHHIHLQLVLNELQTRRKNKKNTKKLVEEAVLIFTCMWAVYQLLIWYFVQTGQDTTILTPTLLAGNKPHYVLHQLREIIQPKTI